LLSGRAEARPSRNPARSKWQPNKRLWNLAPQLLGFNRVATQQMNVLGCLSK